jgi:hypothetical protein
VKQFLLEASTIESEEDAVLYEFTPKEKFMTPESKADMAEIKTLNENYVTNKDKLWKLIWRVFDRNPHIGGGLINAYKWLWEQDLNQSFNQEVFHILNQELIRGLSDTDNLPDMTVSSY